MAESTPSNRTTRQYINFFIPTNFKEECGFRRPRFIPATARRASRDRFYPDSSDHGKRAEDAKARVRNGSAPQVVRVVLS